jgi:hypothetical protein
LNIMNMEAKIVISSHSFILIEKMTFRIYLTPTPSPSSLWVVQCP